MFWKICFSGTFALALLAGPAQAQDATLNDPRDQEVEEAPPEGTILEKREYQPGEETVSGYALQLDFQRMDKDDDGEVTLTEFQEATEEQERYLDAVFHALDLDKDGVVSREEFAEYKTKADRKPATARQEEALEGETGERTRSGESVQGGMQGSDQQDQERRMEQEEQPPRLDMTFSAMDKDADGRVTQEEFESLVDTSDDPGMFDQIDGNDDGAFNREEFLEYNRGEGLWPLAKEQAGEEYGEQTPSLLEEDDTEGLGESKLDE
ncbi:MAG: EF-hand domain-containing protein [Desulfovibrionales bacterium]